MEKRHTIETELANALFRLSYGKLTVKEAERKAHEVASNYDLNNEILAHKGINWYAKKLLAVM